MASLVSPQNSMLHICVCFRPLLPHQHQLKRAPHLGKVTCPDLALANFGPLSRAQRFNNLHFVALLMDVTCASRVGLVNFGQWFIGICRKPPCGSSAKLRASSLSLTNTIVVI